MRGIGIREGLELGVPIGSDGVVREVKGEGQQGGGAANVVQGDGPGATDPVAPEAEVGFRTAWPLPLKCWAFLKNF